MSQNDGRRFGEGMAQDPRTRWPHQAIQILAMLPEDPQLALRFLERAVEILEQHTVTIGKALAA